MTQNDVFIDKEFLMKCSVQRAIKYADTISKQNRKKYKNRFSGKIIRELFDVMLERDRLLKLLKNLGYDDH